MRSTEHRHLACGETGHLARSNCQSAGETPARPTGKMPVLHDALTKHLVLSGEQILHEIVAAFVDVASGSREMMIDSHPR